MSCLFFMVVQSHDARDKKLKSRYACTGVVLWLNDP